MKFLIYKKRKRVQKVEINARKLLRILINVKKMKNHENLGKGWGNDFWLKWDWKKVTSRVLLCELKIPLRR